jgi:glycosyltransferase involved in cell wall biosynthesis
MRILQVIHQFPPRKIGGTEIYVRDLSLALRALGNEVVVFSGDERGEGEYNERGLQIYTTLGGLFPSRSPVKNFLTAFGNKRAEERFLQICKCKKPNVIHFHHLLGLSTKLPSLAHKLGIPTVFTIHDFWLLCSNAQLIKPNHRICQGPLLGLNCAYCASARLGLKFYLFPLFLLIAPLFILRSRLIWRSLKNVDLILTPSNFLRDLFIRYGVREERIKHLDLGIAMPRVWNPLKSNGKKKMKFVYIGAIAWQKGLHILIEAFNGMSKEKAELYIYGDEKEFPRYTTQLRRNIKNPNIFFKGKASREEVWQALSSADVLVVPSIYLESFSLVSQEAFMAKVPVIASRHGALAERVKDGINGLLFSPGDPLSLKRALMKVIKDPKLLRKLRQGIGAVKTIEEHASECEEIYQNLIAKF